MPARPTVVAIVLFWLAAVGWVGYRDVWPRLAASGPPPIAVDLGDEASQLVPVRWVVMRGDKNVGRLVTKMTYVDADDTFRLTHQYTQMTFDFGRVRVVFPDVTMTTRVTRGGDLREQAMTGMMNVLVQAGDGFRKLAEARAAMEGTVTDRVFRGRADIESPVVTTTRDLDPVPVPDGQALSPLQPVGRIGGVRGGQRWVVHEINPLRDAMRSLVKGISGQFGLGVPEDARDAFVATVRAAPEPLAWGKDKAAVPCWVIDYRGPGDAKVRTWVRTDDGRVLRQEAERDGEVLALVRDD